MRNIFLSLFCLCTLALASLPAMAQPQAPRYVALSFDDGPNMTVTPRMLDLLEETGVRASFFVIGSNVNRKTAPILRRMKRLGCDIENHTYTHPDLTKIDDALALSEVARTDSAIFRWVRVRPRMLRPPFTDFNSHVAELIPDKVFIAGLSCQDWRTDLPVEDRITRTLERAKDGDILLFHDSNELTLEAMRTIIPALKERGFIFLTVPELFELRGGMPAPHTPKMYSNVN